MKVMKIKRIVILCRKYKKLPMIGIYPKQDSYI